MLARFFFISGCYLEPVCVCHGAGVNDSSFNIFNDLSKEGEGSDWFSFLF